MDIGSFDLQSIGALALVAGLLPSFAGWLRSEYRASKAKQKDKSEDVIEQYKEWLSRKRHEKLLIKISSSQEVLTALHGLVEKLIAKSQEDREAILDRLEHMYVGLDGKIEGIDSKIDDIPNRVLEILCIGRETGVSSDPEEEYRGILTEELGTIQMLGSPDFSSVPVDLLDTFVSLDITAMSLGQYREGLEPNEMRGEADRKLSPESAFNRAFEDHRMLLILGDPGSGKTTLVKYYAMLCLKGERYKELNFTESPLVIYLPLREIESKDGQLCPLHECLAKWASRHYVSISADTFLGWLKDRQTVILLDGLDEISELEKRQEICEWIDRAATGLVRARFVVTSRWTGYRKIDGIELGFPHLRADVRDFSKAQQTEFLEKWFVAAYQQEPRDKKVPEQQWRKRQEQKGLGRAKAIMDFLAEEENKGVRELAVVPMLLQVIAILWRERENLPEGRAELYQAALKYLLDYRDRRKKIKPLIPAMQALRVLSPVSFWMQDELHCDEVEKEDMHGQMQPILDTMKGKLNAEELSENLRDRAGLIADYGNDSYIFRHKSFREYLSGLELVTKARQDLGCLEKIVSQFGEDWWNEPLRFFMGEVDDTLFDQFMDVLFKSDASKDLDQKSYDLLLTMVSEAPQRRIDSLVRSLNNADSTENQRRYIVDCLKTIGTEEAFEAIKVFGKKEGGTDAGKFAVSVVTEVYTTTTITTTTVKATTGEVVDLFKQLPESFRNRYEYNAEYILIPAGRYKYQGKDEKDVPDIYFAKYPVTNKRYRRFISYLAGKKDDLSEILAVKIFQERMLGFAATIDGFSKYLGTNLGKWTEKLRSEYDDDKRFKGDDQPVVGISWFDAQAYCCWLSMLEAASKETPADESAEKYRLPTELEWEWAASGGKREYPWGDREPNDKMANYNQNVGATTPVGRYPEGATLEGLMDMAGNVWEWMDNWHEKYIGKYRSLHGGSWNYGEGNLRCSCRNVGNPDVRNYSYVGFRVVRSQS